MTAGCLTSNSIQSVSSVIKAFAISFPAPLGISICIHALVIGPNLELCDYKAVAPGVTMAAHMVDSHSICFI